AVAPAAPLPARLDAQFAALPPVFEANEGQTDPSVQFVAHGKGYTAFLTRTEAVFVLAPTPAARPADPAAPAIGALRMQSPAASLGRRAEWLHLLPGGSNSFLGGDRPLQVTDVPNYAQVAYRDLFPGIDLVYHGADQQRLQFDFVVKPGAVPSA